MWCEELPDWTPASKIRGLFTAQAEASRCTDEEARRGGKAQVLRRAGSFLLAVRADIRSRKSHTGVADPDNDTPASRSVKKQSPKELWQEIAGSLAGESTVGLEMESPAKLLAVVHPAVQKHCVAATHSEDRPGAWLTRDTHSLAAVKISRGAIQSASTIDR